MKKTALSEELKDRLFNDVAGAGIGAGSGFLYNYLTGMQSPWTTLGTGAAAGVAASELAQFLAKANRQPPMSPFLIQNRFWTNLYDQKRGLSGPGGLANPY